ncbi:MAG TPA: GAF and ANTAR domain-containing protein [Streptosporangiaceae bacterium]|nr:GAF and ANTAR domain-containing protein [Streptosporangiaceae bacterium]
MGISEVSAVTGGGGARRDPPAAAMDVVAGVSELHDVLLSTQSIEDFVQELAVQAAQLIADSLSCGITLRRGTQHDTVACSDELAGRVNGLQYSLGEGPCLTALADGRPAHSADLTAEPRWPRFGQAAVACGIQSALSLPLVAQDQVIGALNLYARERAAFGPTQTRLAESFAESAAGALALGQRLVSYASLTNQLRASLSSRAVIDQAVGIIMGQERWTQDRAFAALRAASQNRNVKLRVLAEEIVTGVTGAPPVPPRFEPGLP